jgi:hypothetical protein
MTKEPKNRQELTRMIMELIRQRPEWNDVLRVAIIVEWNRTPSNLPNWVALRNYIPGRRGRRRLPCTYMRSSESV